MLNESDFNATTYTTWSRQWYGWTLST
jgi:hypothetical protein